MAIRVGKLLTTFTRISALTTFMVGSWDRWECEWKKKKIPCVPDQCCTVMRHCGLAEPRWSSWSVVSALTSSDFRVAFAFSASSGQRPFFVLFHHQWVLVSYECGRAGTARLARDSLSSQNFVLYLS